MMKINADMRFVQNFTPPEFQVKTFTPSISPNFNSFSDKNTEKWVKMEKFTPLDKNFTLPPAVTSVTNLTSASASRKMISYGRPLTMWRKINSFSFLGKILVANMNDFQLCGTFGVGFWGKASFSAIFRSVSPSSDLLILFNSLSPTSELLIVVILLSLSPGLYFINIVSHQSEMVSHLFLRIEIRDPTYIFHFPSGNLVNIYLYCSGRVPPCWLVFTEINAPFNIQKPLVLHHQMLIDAHIDQEGK